MNCSSYRSSRSWHTKSNFKIFTTGDFLAAAIEHIPPKGQHLVRYYGLYSNKRCGVDAKAGKQRPSVPLLPAPPRDPATTLPAPPAESARGPCVRSGAS
ncbi:MAG: hypothetical protein ACI8UO_006171 [Verrucomicrobiales bacterium]